MTKARIRYRSFKTQYAIRNKQLKKQFAQEPKEGFSRYQWAGFICPSCHETLTEWHGFINGGGKLVCYHCGNNLYFTSFFDMFTNLNLYPAQQSELAKKPYRKQWK